MFTFLTVLYPCYARHLDLSTIKRISNTAMSCSTMTSMTTRSRGAETARSKEEDPCIPEREVRAAIVTCNSGKTQEDNIVAALLKAGGEHVVGYVKHSAGDRRE